MVFAHAVLQDSRLHLQIVRGDVSACIVDGFNIWFGLRIASLQIPTFTLMGNVWDT